MFRGVGGVLVVVGLLLVVAGVAWNAGWLSWLGRLPGDIRVEGEHTRFYFPITTSIVLSVLLSAVLWLLNR